MKPVYAIEFPGGLPAVADVSNEAFLSKLLELPIGDGGVYHIHRINVPLAQRGKGYGSQLLKMICVDADAEHVTLELGVLASGGLGLRSLKAWYKRYGFVEVKSNAMIRSPQ